jgi:hypothetical protein
MLEHFLNKYDGKIIYQNKILRILIINFSNSEEVLFSLNSNKNLKIISNKMNNFKSSFSYNKDLLFLEKIKEYLI